MGGSFHHPLIKGNIG